MSKPHMLDRLTAMHTKYKQARADMAPDVVKEEALRCFQAEPKLQRIVWIQGTPSFNDGDPCIFTIGYPDFMTDEGKYLGMRARASFQEFMHFIHSDLGEELCKEAYGESVEVTIRREGDGVIVGTEFSYMD